MEMDSEPFVPAVLKRRSLLFKRLLSVYGGKTRLKKKKNKPTLEQQLVFDILTVMVGQFVACVRSKPHVRAQRAAMCVAALLTAAQRVHARDRQTPN